jgi:hypothetical protein
MVYEEGLQIGLELNISQTVGIVKSHSKLVRSQFRGRGEGSV